MSQKERMLTNKLYLADSEELLMERKHANELMFKFNNCNPNDEIRKKSLLKKLIPNIGKNYRIKQPFFCDYGYNIYIGDNFFANYNCTILDVASVTIGNNVKLAPNVSILTAAHPIDPIIRNTNYEFGININIGNNVWIGGNTVILPGVKIGNNCVIGAGSVVTKNIPSDAIAVGNPCKVIRFLQEKDKKFYFKDKKIDISY